MKNYVILGVLGVILGGCSSAPISLPSNVATIPSGVGESTYLDKIDHSFTPSKSVDFGQIKLCAASVFTNDTMILQDNSGSFFGSYTGKYYEKNNTQQLAGGDVFKYVDEKTNTLIATGNTKTRPQQGGLIFDYIKYDAKISLDKNNVQLVFQNLKAAQESTGTATNKGFRQIGTWSGARAPAALEAIEKVAISFKGCLN